MRLNYAFTLPFSPEPRLWLIVLGLIIAISLAILAIDINQTQVEIKIAKGTVGLVKQTAIHLSKLNGGQSVGGFPGFEPPDDDEAYRQKIKNSSYTHQDLNNWVKEINNFLRQIIDKNPNMTLAEILRQAGLTASEIDSFIRNLRTVYKTTETLAQLGKINPITAELFKELLLALQVSLTW